MEFAYECCKNLYLGAVKDKKNINMGFLCLRCSSEVQYVSLCSSEIIDGLDYS
jgi:hypothetical protein